MTTMQSIDNAGNESWLSRVLMRAEDSTAYRFDTMKEKLGVRFRKTHMQNGIQFIREKKDEKLAQKEQTADVRRERITFADGIDLEWNGRYTRTNDMVRVKAVNVHRAKERIASPEGIRTGFGYGILITVACILLTVLLVDLGGIGYTNRQINRTETKIMSIRRDNERTETQLADKRGNTQLINQAVQLNMVSSGNSVIMLKAPVNANMTFETEQTAQVSGESLAIIQGD